MTGQRTGKVAFITGLARGQGRSHAVRLAAAGADIIGVDLCEQVVGYPMSTPGDLAETVARVEALGRRIVAGKADVRDPRAVREVLDRGVAELGRLDFVIANAGIMPIWGERAQPKIAPPRFRSGKDRHQAVRFTVNSRFRVLADGRLRLPKIGDVPVRWSRTLPSAPSSVTVIRDAAGRFFASFVVETDPVPLPEAHQDCGIDLGLGHFAVLDDGTKVAAPRFLRRAEKKLKRAQRNLARKQKGSRSRDKARVKVALAHAKVTDARRDFHHKLSTKIIRENQAVYVEDLAVSGLARTRLAKSVHDAGWSAFISMLQYKAALYGREFRRAGRFEPTSQVCSGCGVKDGPKPLHVRQWQCQACGTVHDRDINAAKNIAALGRREARNARGGDGRPPLAAAVAGEPGSRRGAA